MKSKFLVAALVGIVGIAVWLCVLGRGFGSAYSPSDPEVISDTSTALVALHWEAQDHKTPGGARFVHETARQMLLKQIDWRFMSPSMAGNNGPANKFEQDLLSRIPKTQPKEPPRVFAEDASADGKTRLAYVPIYAKESCFACHQSLHNPIAALTDDEAPKLAAGDLMSVAVISISASGK